MMSVILATTIEIGLIAVTFLIVLYALAISYKHSKTIPGADLLFLGLLFYAAYPLAALGAAGFTQSFFDNFCLVGEINSVSYMFFVSYAARLGLILAIIGLFKVGRSLKA